MMKFTMTLIFFLIVFSSCGKQKSTLLIDSVRPLTAKVIPQDAFAKTQEVLQHFNAQEEEESQISLKDLGNLQTNEGLIKVLPFMDPKSGSKFFLNIKNKKIFGYQDYGILKEPDFQISLRDNGQTLHAPVFYQHIQSAKLNSTTLPLLGLRIALDPGHMGDKEWDRPTGKYIHDDSGNILSEGYINFIVAQLLKNNLENLGAEVLVTRNNLHPVSKLPARTFPLIKFARTELQESTLKPWFLSLLNNASSREMLYDSFEKSARLRSLFSESRRSDYFILRADLDARIDLINRFNPDITLIIHFDTADRLDDPQSLNPYVIQATKGFVVGSYGANEFSSRNQRKFFIRHLLDSYSWQTSLDLSRYLITEIKNKLGVKLASSAGPESIEVEPGIFSRNLYVPSRLSPSAVAYIECLFYNEPKEFYRILNLTDTMAINGHTYPNSNRLKQVANTLRDGILNYVRK